ncbi:MAG: trimeric intracellular cation channel family protein, partial [Duncaniella sp.]|nr:trimeric intracellular cation channel family protein [Duncaniella sp.]
IGGGTLRDVLLDIPVFWMQNWLYLAVTGLAFLIVVLFRQVLTSGSKSLFIFDSIGLALFVVIGIQKTIFAGYPMWVAIVMGIITGSFGGVVRDILINVEPLFFRKDIYATACMAGGIIYWAIMLLGGNPILQQSACAVAIIALRVGAIRYGWHLPQLKGENEEDSDRMIIDPKD